MVFVDRPLDGSNVNAIALNEGCDAVGCGARSCLPETRVSLYKPARCTLCLSEFVTTRASEFCRRVAVTGERGKPRVKLAAYSRFGLIGSGSGLRLL